MPVVESQRRSFLPASLAGEMIAVEIHHFVRNYVPGMGWVISIWKFTRLIH